MRSMIEIQAYLAQQHTPQTVKSYVIAIENFLCANPNSKEFTYYDIVNYLEELKRFYVNDATRSTQLSAIKKYYDYLLHTKQRDDHPCRALYIKVMQKPIHLERLFTSQELELLLNRENRYKLLDLRNKAILTLLIYQGLRSEELCALKIKDIDLQGGYVFVRETKRTSRRMLELKPKQILILNDYFMFSRPKLLQVDTDQLLITKQGVGICVETINRMLRPLKGLFPSRTINASTIRQSVIRNWLNEKKYPLGDVQLLAGHKYPSSTERYVLEELEDKRKVINRFHPLG